MYVFCLDSFGSLLRNLMDGGWGSCFYRITLVFFFLALIGLRIPYVFSFSLLFGVIVGGIIPIYVAIMITRMCRSLGVFIACFLPTGSPYLLAPFVMIMEIASFGFRWLVLMLRPAVNLIFGVVLTLMSLCAVEYTLGSVNLILLFYEWVIVVIHWYIVHLILLFSHKA